MEIWQDPRVVLARLLGMVCREFSTIPTGVSGHCSLICIRECFAFSSAVSPQHLSIHPGSPTVIEHIHADRTLFICVWDSIGPINPFSGKNARTSGLEWHLVATLEADFSATWTQGSHEARRTIPRGVRIVTEMVGGLSPSQH